MTAKSLRPRPYFKVWRTVTRTRGGREKRRGGGSCDDIAKFCLSAHPSTSTISFPFTLCANQSLSVFRHFHQQNTTNGSVLIVRTPSLHSQASKDTLSSHAFPSSLCCGSPGPCRSHRRSDISSDSSLIAVCQPFTGMYAQISSTYGTRLTPLAVIRLSTSALDLQLLLHARTGLHQPGS